MRLSIDAYERMAGNVLKIYEQAEIEMTRRVANRVKRGVTQPGWTEQKYSEMKAVTRQMSKVIDSLHRDFNVQAMQYVETGYEDGRSSFINEAREFADLSQIHELTPTAIKIANIMGDLDLSMSAADRLILRQANDAYANIIGETSALIATGSYTEKQAVQIALNRFADKGISSFVDKAGRHWEMTTYAEMATLTAIERATRQGYTDTMQEFGFDLAIISSHYGACPLCEAWENVVISISGKDTRYPSLSDAEAGGCFHPRCMHVFSTYYDGITRGGRDRPRPVGPANPGYAARSQQRAWERQERKWKRRMAAATTPEEERAAYARVRMYQDKIRGLVADYNNTVDPSVDYLPRKYDREGGRVKLSEPAKRLKPIQIKPVQLPPKQASPSVEKFGKYTETKHDEEYRRLIAEREEAQQKAYEADRAARRLSGEDRQAKFAERDAYLARADEIRSKELSKYAIEATMDEAQKRDIEYLPIHKQDRKLTGDETISRLAGGDLTSGSCASLAYCYIGQKAGYDVLDFRGGASQDLIASNNKAMLDSLFINGYDSVQGVAKNYKTAGKRALKHAEVGKEYMFSCGRHAAIVRRTEKDAYEYLELQSSWRNGWIPFQSSEMDNVLKYRFGADIGGFNEAKATLVSVDQMSQDDRVLKILGYINTPEDRQLKGSRGHER